MQDKSEIVSPFNNPLIGFISRPKYRWLRHTIFIGMGLILAFKGDVGLPENTRSAEAHDAILLVDVISYIVILSLLYLILYVLVPKLLFRSRLLLFGLSCFIIIVVMYLAVWALDEYLIRPTNPAGFQHVELSVFNFIQVGAVAAVLIGFVVGLKVFQKWINDVQRMNELQQVNLRVELEQLKSQVNPHFLFNTLNNLFVLTKTDPEKASQVLLGLSDLLRYQLYDSTREKVMLSRDIDFIQNLLELEKIRKNDFEYSIHTEGNIDGQAVPPFIFIPFVENAIKHGASAVGHSYLTLYFGVTRKELHFYSENSKPALKQNKIGGLGLGNIQRRLDLLFPGRHSLEIEDAPDKYVVNLTIPL